MTLAVQTQRFVFPGGPAPSEGIVGADLASAATLVPTHAIHRVTGTTEIVNITPPDPGLACMLVLIAQSGIWTWSVAGNILLAGTVTAADGKFIMFIWNPQTQKWSPHRTV
jgi:hypothetical protein